MQQGWHWRMQGIFSWLWENHDDVNYYSSLPVSCVFSPECLPGDNLRADTPQPGDTGGSGAPEQSSACRQFWPSPENAQWHREVSGSQKLP